jgi:hypothetical protein
MSIVIINHETCRREGILNKKKIKNQDKKNLILFQQDCLHSQVARRNIKTRLTNIERIGLTILVDDNS